MTGTPFSFVRPGEIETANRAGVDEGGNKGDEESPTRGGWEGERKGARSLGEGVRERERRKVCDRVEEVHEGVEICRGKARPQGGTRKRKQTPRGSQGYAGEIQSNERI